MTVDAAELGRLRWRCRRGTRELDRLLEGWLAANADRAAPQALHAFSLLLDAADPDLWDWLIARRAPADPRLVALVDEIRAQSRV